MRKASDTCLNVNRTRFIFNGILLKFGDERMELSQKLKELRKKQGLTQLELAERLFVSRQAISGWEAGTSRPSTENLQSLSKLYNVPLEMLLDDAEAAGPEPEMKYTFFRLWMWCWRKPSSSGPVNTKL